MTREDVQRRRDSVTDQKATKREKAMRRAADLEARAQRCRSMARQLEDEAYSATIEAVTLRVMHR